MSAKKFCWAETKRREKKNQRSKFGTETFLATINSDKNLFSDEFFRKNL